MCSLLQVGQNLLILLAGELAAGVARLQDLFGRGLALRRRHGLRMIAARQPADAPDDQ